VTFYALATSGSSAALLSIIRNNIADGFEGSPYYARHRQVVGNTYSDNLSRNGGLGMTFRDGASNNVVERFRTENVGFVSCNTKDKSIPVHSNRSKTSLSSMRLTG
jgi:hypothetical protein